MKISDNLTIGIDYRIIWDVDVATFDNIYTEIPDKVYHEFSLFLRNIMKKFEEAEFHIHTSQMNVKKILYHGNVRFIMRWINRLVPYLLS